mgnify:CR=1 FL=1
MEPVLFYGVPHGCSFGSIVALEWLGRPYRLCRIEMPLETGERTYVRLNPARQTPTLLLEDGRALSESLAILQHLAARDLCRKLGYPQGSAEFDELNFALALLHTDAYLAGTARWGRELGYFDLQHDFPRLHRHLEKLEQDPAVRFAHAIEDRLPAQSCGEFRGEVTLAEVASRLLA